jgi:hypothetical protein
VLFAIALLVVAFLAFGGGYLLGSERADEAPAPPSPIPTAPATPSLSPSPVTPSPSPEPNEVLTDGTYFIDATRVLDGPPLTLEFDLAYYLTGSDAEQAAADHGVALDTDYFIVNDNPTLRQLPVSPTVQVRYVPEGACCELQPGLFDPWAAAVNAELQTDYKGSDAFWWIRVRGGQIVLIEEQFLP